MCDRHRLRPLYRSRRIYPANQLVYDTHFLIVCVFSERFDYSALITDNLRVRLNWTHRICTEY